MEQNFMNDLYKQIAKQLNITTNQINAVLKLLEEGSTVPFIARYRKEVTGALDEEQIREISKTYEYGVNLQQRKDDVIRLIDEKGMLTCLLYTSYRAPAFSNKSAQTSGSNFSALNIGMKSLYPNSFCDPYVLI